MTTTRGFCGRGQRLGSTSNAEKKEKKKKKWEFISKEWGWRKVDEWKITKRKLLR